MRCGKGGELEEEQSDHGGGEADDEDFENLDADERDSRDADVFEGGKFALAQTERERKDKRGDEQRGGGSQEEGAGGEAFEAYELGEEGVHFIAWADELLLFGTGELTGEQGLGFGVLRQQDDGADGIGGDIAMEVEGGDVGRSSWPWERPSMSQAVLRSTKSDSSSGVPFGVRMPVTRIFRG